MKCFDFAGNKSTDQNKCPHLLTTASLAVSKQILHSKAGLSESLSLLPPLFPDSDVSALIFTLESVQIWLGTKVTEVLSYAFYG